MTLASTGVALVATQLAKTDRRALSQAWYSALHLAGAERGRSRSISMACNVAASRVSRSPAPQSPPVFCVAAAGMPHAPQPATVGRTGADVFERRAVTSDLTHRIERAMTRVARAVPSARVHAHTIDLGNGRVRLLVRTGNGATRIIALCATSLRPAVERALAHTRFTLAAAGSNTIV